MFKSLNDTKKIPKFFIDANKLNMKWEPHRHDTHEVCGACIFICRYLNPGAYGYSRFCKLGGFATDGRSRCEKFEMDETKENIYV